MIELYFRNPWEVVYALHRTARKPCPHFTPWPGPENFGITIACTTKLALIISWGLTTPADFLKVLALGADAVYIGTIALYALSHTQVLKVLPWNPPVNLVFQESSGHKRLQVNQAATSLANFLTSCTLEIAEAIKGLGKNSVVEVTRHDLVALDPDTAAAAGVPLAYRTP